MEKQRSKISQVLPLKTKYSYEIIFLHFFNGAGVLDFLFYPAVDNNDTESR